MFSPANTLVLHNPGSGRREAQRRAAAVIQHLSRKGFHIIQAQLVDRALVRELGKTGGSVICIGGDGTLFHAIADIPPSVPIGLYPAGTINLLAHGLSIPQSIDTWLTVLQRGVTRDVYFGQANSRPFVSVGSVGFDASVVARVSPWLKKRFHEGAYAMQALWELPQYRIPTYEVVVDGKKIQERIVGVIVSKGPYFAGPHPMFKNADHCVPKLSVALLKGDRRSQIVRYACGLFRGTLSEMDGVMMYSAEKIEVRAHEKSDMELDGEPFGLASVTFSVEPIPRKVLAL